MSDVKFLNVHKNFGHVEVLKAGPRQSRVSRGQQQVDRALRIAGVVS